VQEFDDIFDKEITKYMLDIKYKDYLKEKIEKETYAPEDNSNLTWKIGFLCF
jgi:hypothetical protein